MRHNGARKLTWGMLKELLKDADDNSPILLSRDPEGNGFRHLTAIDDTAEIYDTYRDGEVGVRFSADPPTRPRCLILFPL